MTGLIMTWLVTTVSFLIISRLPFLGIEVDSFSKAATIRYQCRDRNYPQSDFVIWLKGDHHNINTLKSLLS